MNATVSHADEYSALLRDIIGLTVREVETLQRFVDGNSVPETAKAMGISQKTVKNHLTAAYRKLGVQDRTQAVLKALRVGYVTL